MCQLICCYPGHGYGYEACSAPDADASDNASGHGVKGRRTAGIELTLFDGRCCRDSEEEEWEGDQDGFELHFVQEFPELSFEILDPRGGCWYLSDFPVGRDSKGRHSI